MLSISADQALAFRASSHHLGGRLPAGRLEDAARVGMQDRPPDRAGPAFLARVDDLTPDAFRNAVDDGRLATLYAMRGAAYVVPSHDVTVFTAGSLPSGEESLREAILAWALYLDSVGFAAPVALQTITDAIAAILREAGGPVTKGGVSGALHDVLPAELEVHCPGCGIRHAPEPLFRLGLVEAGSRLVGPGTGAAFVAADPPPRDATVRREARVELARRYVHCYGPTVPDHFAAWTGAGRKDARDAFATLELAEVKLEGRKAWVLSEDLEAVEHPAIAPGARLLPRDDPYLNQRDRATLAVTKDLQRRLWTPTGSTATVLVDGRLAGLWKGRKKGRTFTIEIDPLVAVSTRARKRIEEEAVAYAAFRGATEAVVTIDE